MGNLYHGLPAWAVDAASATDMADHPISHIFKLLKVEYTPNNLRILKAAVDVSRIDMHDFRAKEIARIKSVGVASAYLQFLVRWSALEDADAAEAEHIRTWSQLRAHNRDPRACADQYHQTILASYIRSGYFNPDGEPAEERAIHRAALITHAAMQAIYEQGEEERERIKKERQDNAAADRFVDWFEDHDAGETKKPREPEIGEVVPGEIPTVKIYKAVHEFNSRDHDARKQLSKNLEKQLELRGGATESDFTEVISTVFGEHPWFAEPIDYIWKRGIDAIEDGKAWFQIPPTLIWGPPGCGKTHFLSRLAELSGVVHRRLDFSSIEGGMAIAGSDARWGNSRPGAVVETIAQTGCANPMFIIDEVEKAGKNRGTQDPHHALLPMLQQDTARTFFDPSLGAPVDLSFASYAFAANEIWPLPAPLLDRVRVFEVRYPRGPQLRDLIERRLAKCGASEEVIEAVQSEIERGRLTLRILDRIEMRLREVMRQPVLH